MTGVGTVALSPFFSLPHTLLVPSLSNKLLSVGQVTEELQCCALMYPSFCLFQDILTKEIIGHGTKSEGLYYMTSAMIKQLTYTSLTIRNGRFGYGIIGWDIPHFGIYVVYF